MTFDLGNSHLGGWMRTPWCLEFLCSCLEMDKMSSPCGMFRSTVVGLLSKVVNLSAICSKPSLIPSPVSLISQLLLTNPSCQSSGDLNVVPSANIDLHREVTKLMLQYHLSRFELRIKLNIYFLDPIFWFISITSNYHN